MTTLSEDQLAELREDFEYNDTDGDGRIGLEEFVALMKALDGDMSRDECLLGFQYIDKDGDGSVSFGEFAEWWSEE